MRIRIRIYMDKEPELYALYKASGPSLTRKIFKSALISYLEGESFDIDIPKITIQNTVPFAPNPMFDISISDEYKDALDKLPDRSISTFTKTLVRYYAFWALTDAFGVPHKQAVMPEPVKETTKKQTNKVVPIQKQEGPVKAVPTPDPEPKQDILAYENSDLNSLAALFGNIQMN